MKLVFYSGGDHNDNFALDKKLVKLSGSVGPKMTFIPSCSYMCEVDFSEFVEQFRRFNIERFINFPIDVPISEVLKKEAFSSDIIHLSGGNTYYFLYHLRKNNLMKDLKDFVQRGGILTGLSAGAIIMTKDIATAGFPSFDKDINYNNLKNLKSLDLVDFDFFPHYRNSKRYQQEMIKYSKERRRPLYAARDGSGIIIDHDQVSFVGHVYCFNNGDFFRVTN